MNTGLVEAPTLTLDSPEEKKTGKPVDLLSLLSDAGMTTGNVAGIGSLFSSAGNGKGSAAEMAPASTGNSYLDGLKSDGSGYADQPEAKWYRTNKDDAETLYQGGQSVVDWSKLGYSGSILAGGEAVRDGGGEINGVNNKTVTPEFQQFMTENNYDILRGQNSENFQLYQLTKDGKPVAGASKSYSLANNDAYGVVQAIVNTGLAYGASLAAAGGSAAGASGATASTSASSTSALEAGLTKAGTQAAVSGASTAAQGGDINDILKSAVIGGVSSGAGSAVGGFNPAGYLGVDNPALQQLINKSITTGGMAAVTGGNPGSAVGGSLLKQLIGGMIKKAGS